jgi:hemolysin activation/secretion protein
VARLWHNGRGLLYCKEFRCPGHVSGWLFLITVLTVEIVLGQPVLPPIDPSGRSGSPPPPQQEDPLQPKESPAEILPPVEPEPEELKEQGPVLRVFVKQIQVVGSTALPPEELQQITAAYENREVTTDDLEEMRKAVTMAYVTKGYPNSGAILPDQAIIDGMITLQVIEGRLSEIRIEGAKWFRPSYLRNRIERGAGPPLHSALLRDRL